MPDHGGYCNLHGRHMGYECPECPYEAKIAELQSKLDRYQWIPVSERRPDSERNVAVFGDADDEPESAWWDAPSCAWYDRHGVAVPGITHWAELPEPPK